MELLPETKKIHALIPETLFERMQKQHLLDDGWDNWIAKLIDRELRLLEGER